MYRKISKEKLPKWLGALKGQAEVLAPAKRNGFWTFQKFESQDLPQSFQNSRLSPKGLFLESLKALFESKTGGGISQIKSFPPGDSQRVLFGLRPCDARALKILEPVFAKDYPDAFYLQNLSRTILLGLACRVQCPDSFCGDMGIHPRDSIDFDIFLRQIPSGYIARISTEKGKALMAGDFFEEGSEEEWIAAQGKLAGGREKSLFDLERVKAGAVARFSDENFWKHVSSKCINCGICTYLCPTCHCFDLSDLQMPGEAVRFRCWDSCAFPDFTKMTVHNPREETWRRYRQRVSHKFNFFYQNFQTIACVGCGRCVAHCPVNLDLREVLQEMVL